MKTEMPLIVYFDASCLLCNSEMQNIKAHDVDDAVILVDCSAPDFDDSPFRAEGITRDAMMKCLHARDANDTWLKGVAAFEVIYRSVGIASVANMWAHPLIRPLAERVYPWIARHRNPLSMLGVHKLFNLWSRYVARRSNQLSQACKDNSCRINRQ